MKGIVVSINLNKGFVAIDTEDGISVVELLGGYDIDIEDIITGDLDSLGGETLFNKTKNEEIDVFIQDIYCSIDSIKSLMA